VKPEPFPATIILASRSPERQAILREFGISAKCEPVDFDETPLAGETASELVGRLARGKAQAVQAPIGWVIAADTVVVFAEQILGKPHNLREAKANLWKMSGQSLQVFSGTAVRSPQGEIQVQVDVATLSMCVWTEQTLGDYMQTDLWQNRAGGFSMGHQPCPVELRSGRRDVVRGIHGEFVVKCLRNR
jgi:MAF protein